MIAAWRRWRSWYRRRNRWFFGVPVREILHGQVATEEMDRALALAAAVAADLPEQPLMVVTAVLQPPLPELPEDPAEEPVAQEVLLT